MNGHGPGFLGAYAQALAEYVETPGEPALATGFDLGRQALAEGIGVLEVVEEHFRLVGMLGEDTGAPAEGVDTLHLDFLMQTLAPLDVASRGFLPGTRGLRRQRERADELAATDRFRRALVGALQDGFFVADSDRCIVEVNAAFGELTGYGADGLPYHWPYPWLGDEAATSEMAAHLRADRRQSTMPVRHRDGRMLWMAVNTNSIGAFAGHEGTVVGTMRDVTTERAARAREQLSARLSDELSAATTVADVLSSGLREGRAALGASAAVAAWWTGGEEQPAIAGADPAAPSCWGDLDATVRTALEQVRRRPTLTVTTVPAERRPGYVAGLAAPVGIGGDCAVYFEFTEGRPSQADDRALMVLLLGHLSIAMQRARSFDDVRRTSLTLQRAMLGKLDPSPWFAVRYEPAVPPLEIGGDWYDVLPLSSDRFGIVVGDCVGRGLAAAAVMGQLRASCRALLARGVSPGQVIDDLDLVAAHVPGAACSTVFVAVLDARTATVQYSSAGHVPPMVIGPESPVRLLDAAASVPLATFDRSPRPEATAVLAPGATVLMYTDGLVERRTEDIDSGITAVMEALASRERDAPGVAADGILESRRPAAGYDDDVALLVYRQPPDPLAVDCPATADRLAGLRREVDRWLGLAAVPPAVAADFVFAINEACTNAVEHAYRNRPPGPMSVRLRADGDVVDAEICDTGRWQPIRPSTTRGRGLALMRALCQRVEVSTDGRGTTVRLTLRRPAPRFRGPVGG
ncbi:SpoIIE family protein phosphatase [Speluncibacter jeojiensis]|uniref:SpoIIE family protein phosphatase n=1 Tax=Speluncibacter jeojiensis TaxID=2710754 RepID=A0A9X4LYT6_9ACTN|nr:SpoIIE family protein phosphatase [Corynebacteriales bacterium D3-21]